MFESASVSFIISCCMSQFLILENSFKNADHFDFTTGSLMITNILLRVSAPNSNTY